MSKSNQHIFFRTLGYCTFFTAAILLFFLLVGQDKSPDKKIIGKWREVSWEYEKVNKGKKGTVAMDKEITEDVRNDIAQNLIIHRAETWEFLPNGRLLLHKGNGTTTRLGWKLKGRGHVLKLHYLDEQIEYYDLSELSKGNMVLYFDIEIQAKGIVRMKFEKIT